MGEGVVGRADKRDVAVQAVCCDTPARKPLDRQGDRHAGCARSAFEVVRLTPTSQPNRQSESLKREVQFFSKRANVHPKWFAQSEHLDKPAVRTIRDDKFLQRSHNASMSRSPKSTEQYDDLRQASGWFLAAWRAERRLTLQELAVAMNTSRGQVSDLENGAVNKRGVQTRYNRDWLELACKALDVSAGDLIDTNPFREKPRFAAVRRAFPDLADGQVEQLVRFAEVMETGKVEAA